MHAINHKSISSPRIRESKLQLQTITSALNSILATRSNRSDLESYYSTETSQKSPIFCHEKPQNTIMISSLFTILPIHSKSEIRQDPKFSHFPNLLTLGISETHQIMWVQQPYHHAYPHFRTANMSWQAIISLISKILRVESSQSPLNIWPYLLFHLSEHHFRTLYLPRLANIVHFYNLHPAEYSQSNQTSVRNSNSSSWPCIQT